jgi:diguanylate cyclase (GGDEF)-like protein
VLQHVATRIRSVVRETDLVARQGGDEFLVLLADLEAGADGETARTVVDEARDRIGGVLAEPLELGIGVLSVRASVGSALFPFEAGDVRSLLRLADEAMYEHRRNRDARAIPLRDAVGHA